ncbi:penicillin-binding protein 2 [Candidatus Neomarinimicrobiota bacterium]
MPRRNLLAVFILVAMAAVGFRFFQLQILYHEKYVSHAEDNSIREVRVPAPRGIMYDRHGNFIVTNRPVYSLAVIPAEVQGSVTELMGLTRYLELPGEDIKRTIEEADQPYQRFQPITLQDGVNFIQRTHIEEHRLEFPGIFFIDRAIRHYPSRARATHVIGYLRDVSEDDYELYRREGYHLGDLVGYSGLEKQYEQVLRGEDGYRYHLVDYLLRDLGEVPDKPFQRPLPGQDLQLTLDIELQALCENLMEGRRGALVAMEPQSGELYAYVSAPDYVLAPFTGPIPVSLWEQWKDHPDNILMDRVINGLYPPGSTFKLISVAAALASGKISPEDTVECTNIYRFGNRDFHCNMWPGHGYVNMEDAVRLSCNIYFYKLIQWIGFEAWADMAFKFGFGSPTGIDLSLESKGLVPTPDYMDRAYAEVGWTPGHLLNLVLGQGDLLATPLQVAWMTATIANGGRLVTPKLVITPAQKETRERAIGLPSSVWRHIQRSMYQVVNGRSGTGFRAKVEGGDIFGKTGTSENPHGDSHSWFSGYAKAKSNRQLVVTVLVEQGGRGSRVAAPMAAEVFRYFLDNYENGSKDLAQGP